MAQMFNLTRNKFNRKYLLLIFFPLACWILFTLNHIYFVGAIFLLITGIQMIIKIPHSWLRMFGVEIGYFFTIIMGYMFGPKAGFIFGCCYVLFHWGFKMLMEPNIADLLIVAFIVPLMGLLAGIFSGLPLIYIGMMLTLFHIIGVLMMEFLVFGELHAMILVWPTGELIFMYLMFKFVGPVISLSLGI